MVKEELDKQAAAGVIEPVIEATDWVHPLVVVSKPNGGISLCVDLQKLNQNSKCPYYPTRFPNAVGSNIALASSLSQPWTLRKDTGKFPWKRKVKF